MPIFWFSWTVCMIHSFRREQDKDLLKVYLPSMKQDEKILMCFLPYVFLQSIIEGAADKVQDVHDEIAAVMAKPAQYDIDDVEVIH